jgi:hypothetical protein
VAAQFAADFETVLAGQHNIQQDQIERAFPGEPGGRDSVADCLHHVPFHLEIVLQPEGDPGFVFHH